MKLTKKQTTALDFLEDDVTNEILFGGGAGGAKSVLGCYWLAKNCLKYPGTRWLMGRATLKTLRETTLNSFFWVAKQQGLRPKYHYVYNPQNSIIRFPATESEILLKDLDFYPSDPDFDELGSLEITGAFVDETNQIIKKAWNITKSRIRYKLDENNIVPKILGTCNPAKNWTYSDFYKPSKNGTLPENKAFVQALLTDNPFISEHYRNNLLSMDENSKQRLLYGNWEYDDDPAALMSIQKITDIFTNDFVPHGERYISADIARLGRDTTVIGIWDGMRLLKIVTLPKNRVPEATALIKKLAKEYYVPYSNIVIDEDGVGGGVVDDVDGCIGFVNNSSPLPNPESGEVENFNHLKSQCYFKLADKINKNELYICDTEYRDKIVQELEQVKQHNMDKDMKKQVVPKDKVKELLGRSPDYSDMLMMRMRFEYDARIEYTFDW